MTSKAKIKKFKKEALVALNKAIGLAVDDVGFIPETYGMLESRVEWYLDIESKTYGYLIKTKFDRDEGNFYIVGCVKV